MRPSVHRALLGRGIPLPKWRAALHLQRKGVRNAKIALIGDSTSMGWGSNGAASTNCRIKSSAQYLADRIGGNTDSIWGDQNTTAALASFSGYGSSLHSRRGMGVATLKFRVSHQPSKAGVLEQHDDHERSFVHACWIVRQDRGLVSHQHGFGYDHRQCRWRADASNAEWRVLRLALPKRMSPARLALIRSTWREVQAMLGLAGWSPTTLRSSKFSSIKWGYAGARIADLINSSAPWSALNCLSAVAPDLVFLNASINNGVDGTAIGTYTAGVQTAITAAKTAGADVILMSGFPTDTSVVSLADAGELHQRLCATRGIQQTAVHQSNRQVHFTGLCKTTGRLCFRHPAPQWGGVTISLLCLYTTR